MTYTKRNLGVLTIVFVMATLLGCGESREEASKRKWTEVVEVLLLYHLFLGDEKAPPADEKEFSAWVSAKQPKSAATWSHFQTQNYKVYWGVDPKKVPAEASNTILIHPGDA